MTVSVGAAPSSPLAATLETFFAQYMPNWLLTREQLASTR